MVVVFGVLLTVAVTVTGRYFAITGIMAAFIPLVVCVAWRKSSKRVAILAGILLVALVVGLTSVVTRAPKGIMTEQSKTQNLYADGGAHFCRYALGNLLPEIDQLGLGFLLMPVADPLFTQKQASELKAWTATIYRELEADEAFYQLGSAMPEVYADLLGGSSQPKHAYLYIPPTLDRSKPVPALIFMHGSGGNFKAYLWLLSRLADRLSLVVLAPSCGMGNWRWLETAKIVDAAVAAAQKYVKIAPDNIHVAGLSNGGLGVCQLARDSGSRYRSLIFLSPVFDAEAVQSYAFAHECRQSKVFVLTGELDDRVPVDYVRKNAELLSRLGATVTLEVEAQANHFLFFSHREHMLVLLEKWIRTNQ